MESAIPHERAPAPAINATQLSNSIAALLSASDPPFLTPEWLKQGDGLATISGLIDPSAFMESNGNDLWTALDSRVVSSSIPVPSDVAASSHETPLLSGPIYDDGSISLSCSLFPTSIDDVTVTPYTIELVTLPASATTSILTLDDEYFHSAAWWNLPEWMRRTKPALPEPEKTIIVAKKVYIIPTDRVTIRAVWWGYSIYLPHSIMLKLAENVDPSLDSISTISKALSFIIANIPDSLVGLPGVALLKALAPIISLIASFLAWSWKSIKSDDKGNGVILSATWLLPVAIVPRTWKVAPAPPPVEAAPSSSGTLFVEHFGTVKEVDRVEFIRRSSQEVAVEKADEREETKALESNPTVQEIIPPADTTFESPTVVEEPPVPPTPTLHITEPSDTLPPLSLPASPPAAVDSPPPLSPISATSSPSESSKRSAKLIKKRVVTKTKYLLHFGRKQSDSDGK